MGSNNTSPHWSLPVPVRTGSAKWFFILSLLASPVSLPFAANASAAGVVSEAQQGTVTGTVTDTKGEPLPGVNVIIEGTTKGTITDFDGKFSLSGVPAGANLVFSFIGFNSATLPAANGMTVQLEDESQQVEEVQVVAYGAQKKVTVTGAISSVKSEDLVRTPVSSVSNVLAGQLSGVTTVQYSGEPGSDAADIFVRGKASFAGGDAVKPLVQVDGVEREMYDIDPNEIESITVLKDASATAVFGVRGANGVILVTTKRGKEGKANISVSTAFSALSPTKMVKMANSLDYAKFYNQTLTNDGNKTQFSDEVINMFETKKDPIRFPSLDWADFIMKDFTLQTQSNLSISGGNDKVKYFVSAGMFTQGGLFDQFEIDSYIFDYRYKRFNYRSNIDIDVTKYTKLAISVSGKLDRTNKPITGQGSSGMIKNIYYSTPFSSPGFVDGKLIMNTTSTSDNMDGKVLPFVGGNGMAYYTSGGCYRQDNNKISMDLGVTQKLDMLTQGLSIRAKGSYNSSFYIQKECNGASVATYTPIVSEDGSMRFRKNGEDMDPTGFKNTLGKGRDWYIEAAVDYNRTFAEKHSIKALFLYNQSKGYYPKTYSDIARTYVGIVSRLSYDYRNRYMAEVNFGRNGSENFAEDRRFGSFPAASAGWVVSEEGFMESLKPMLSFLKIRASWGLVGNDKIGGNRFMYTPDPYSTNNNSERDHNGLAYDFGVNDTYTTNACIGFSNGAGPSQKMLNNAIVSWEKAFKQDYGIDVNFLDNRLSCTFDYYYEKRKDILAQDGTKPGILGFDQPYTNFGKVNSWGWEASANWNDKINDDWRIWVKFNISHNQNEIVEDRQASQKNEFQYTKGRRIGARSQFKFWRFYDENADALYQKQFGKPMPQQTLAKKMRPGDAIFVDLDGNGLVDNNDKTRDLGFTDDPEYIAGLTMGFAWKRLTFNAQLTGAWKVSRMISDVFRKPFANSNSDNRGGLLQYHVDNTWTEAHPSQSAEYPRATFMNAQQNYADCDLYEKDSKYLRLKTAEISYDFKFNWMETVGLKRFQVAFNGYNLLTFTPYLWGDPEARASNAPSYPLQRTYTASLKLNF